MPLFAKAGGGYPEQGNLVFYSESGDETVESGKVSEWPDRSAITGNLTQTVAANRLAWNDARFPNGKAGFGVVAATSTWLDLPSTLVLGEFSIFMVVFLPNPRPGANGYLLQTGGNPNEDKFVCTDQGTAFSRVRLTIGGHATQPQTAANVMPSSGAGYLLEAHRDAAGDVTIFVNETDETQGTPNVPLVNTYKISDFPRISSYTGPDLGAIVVYDVSAADATRTYWRDRFSGWR